MVKNTLNVGSITEGFVLEKVWKFINISTLINWTAV